ncbi:hypothetical protein [Bacillus alkalicellulosilyticus]|uniref:hypothetical protein n=1 Tax=Alkalihalobacterium alkalicellulosilyticum TaxID=1912214 RepID=UPI00099774C0|nr:hypothetical protein [Bacillus alkalicellulosilyticus]
MEYGGIYHVVANGRIIREYFENGTQKFAVVDHIPEERIGGSRELDSALEGTSIWFVDYLSPGNAIKNTGKKIGEIALSGFNKGTGKSPSGFADRGKLEGHFDKHGKEFDGLYKNADEYLEGAKEVISNGIKVKYEYKGEIRTGYVKFLGNNKNGKAKFEFVGTNNNGDITTYHIQSGKKIWKTINGGNIPVINPAE